MVVTAQPARAGVSLVSRLTTLESLSCAANVCDPRPDPSPTKDFSAADRTVHSNVAGAPATGNASASGTARVESQISVNNTSGTLHVTGSGGTDADAIGVAQKATASSNPTGTILELTFDLTDKSYNYTVTGNASATNTRPQHRNGNGCGLTISGAQLIHQKEVSGGGNANLAGSGTVPPGRYVVSVFVTNMVDAGGNSAQTRDTASTLLTFTIDFTPVGQPAPTPTPVRWTNASGGTFATAGNWTPQAVPGGNDTAIFDLASTYTVNVGPASLDRLEVAGGNVSFTNMSLLFVNSLVPSPGAVTVNDATLNLVSGELDDESASIGNNLHGIVNVRQGATWTTRGNLRFGSSTATIQSGAKVTSGETFIGHGLGSANATIDGTAKWKTDKKLHVGFDRPGTLTITGGGAVTNALDAGVGSGSAGDGKVVIRGVDGVSSSAWFVSGELRIGDPGVGDVTVRDGGVFGAASIFIGNEASGIGSVTLSGVHAAAPPIRSRMVPTSDIRVNGTLLIEDGALLDAALFALNPPMTIARVADGKVTVHGFDAAANLQSEIVGVSDLVVGESAHGKLILEEGGLVASNTGSIGHEHGGEGTAIIKGSGNNVVSRWTVAEKLTVGASGTGHLQISDLAGVDGQGEVTIGSEAGSVGDAVVSGGSPAATRSSLFADNFNIGLRGKGTLVIAAGAVVGGTNMTIGGSDTGRGTVLINPTSGTISRVELLRDLTMGSDFFSNGFLFVNADGEFNCDNATVGAIPGLAQVFVGMGSGAPGRFKMRDNLTVGDTGSGVAVVTLLNGAVVSVGGVCLVGHAGFILGNGTLAAATQTKHNGGYIQPGLSPGLLTIAGDFSQSSDATLLMEAAGTAPGQYDVLHITGNAVLAGALQVTFLNGYLPKTGDVLPFVRVDGAATGGFANITFPQLAPGFSAKKEMVNGKFQITALNDAVAPRTSLVNLSTRLQVGTDDKALIGGFILQGSGAKKIMVRAIGPSLGAAGLVGALADPTLELHGPTGAIIATNDNWYTTQTSGVITADEAGEIRASTIAPSDPAESAIVVSAGPGAYTAVIRGANNTTGVGLVEVYDLSAPIPARLANISTRGFVQTGENVMIGGFIVGNQTTKVILRAIGPSLAGAGVSNALADPILELHNGQGSLILANDNWKDSQRSDIEATTIAPTNDKEAAILTTLPSGAYSAVVRGAGSSTGVGLVEVYALQ